MASQKPVQQHGKAREASVCLLIRDLGKTSASFSNSHTHTQETRQKTKECKVPFVKLRCKFLRLPSPIVQNVYNLWVCCRISVKPYQAHVQTCCILSEGSSAPGSIQPVANKPNCSEWAKQWRIGSCELRMLSSHKIAKLCQIHTALQDIRTSNTPNRCSENNRKSSRKMATAKQPTILLLNTLDLSKPFGITNRGPNA